MLLRRSVRVQAKAVVLLALVVGCGRAKESGIELRNSAITQLARSGWVATASPTGTEVAANALDGNLSTRWNSGVNQANGQWFQVDMQSAQSFNEISLETGSSTGTSPAGFQVNVSSDGANWGTPIATRAGTSGAVTIRFLTQMTYRYVRITQTGTKSSTWTIHELNLWLDTQPCDTCQAGNVCQVAKCDPGARTVFPTNGLMGLWHLDGDGKDASDNANHFTTIAAAATSVHGVQGFAYDFGSTAYMNQSNNWAIDPTPAPGVTFVAWVKPGAACPGSFPLYQRGTQIALQLSCTGSGAPGLSAALNTGSGFTFSSPVGSVPQGQWSLVAMTWDKTTVKFFVNGQLVGSSPKTGSLVTQNTSTYIGGYTTSFLGTVDEAALYGRALDLQTELAPLGAEPSVCTMPPKCADPDTCHAADCNPTTGVCSATPPAKPAGTACNDGKACTDNDVCTAAGVCAGTVNCAAPPAVCDESTCDTGFKALPASDVMGKWLLDGDLLDASGHGLTLTNGAGAQSVTGKFGQALHFDSTAVGAYVQTTPTEGFNGPMGVTLAAWVKPDTGFCPSSALRTLLKRPSELGLQLQCRADNTIGTVLSINYATYNPVGTVPVGQWSHVAIVYNRPSVTIYFNGLNTGGYNVGNLDIQHLNPWLYVGTGAMATIDEPMMIRRALTAAEMAALYQSPRACNVHPKTCVATDSCHLTGTCDAVTGCSNPAKADGTACGDDNVCTTGETCHTDAVTGISACNGGTQVNPSCAPPSAPCSENGICNSAIPTPPANGLVGWWRFEGDTRDSSGHGLDLNRQGGQLGPGKVGMAMEFDGNTCLQSRLYAQPEFNMSSAQGVTMMAWVKISPSLACPSSSPLYRSIVGKGNDYQMVAGCWGSSWAGLTHAFRVQSGATDWAPGYNGNLPTTAWSLVAVTFDRHTIQRYINGAPAGTRLLDGNVANSDPTFSIGCQTSYYYPALASLFKGSIDEVTLYNRVLTQTDVQLYYQAATTNACTYPDKPFGAVCDDGNMSTSDETCRDGGSCLSGAAVAAAAQAACVGKAEGDTCSPGKTCAANNVCHNGVCGGGDPADAICLNVDAVVDMGGGQLRAVFGYNNHASTTVLPSPNEVKLGNTVVPFPQPPPPAWLPTGVHHDAFQQPFPSGPALSWRINGQRASTMGVVPIPVLTDPVTGEKYITLPGAPPGERVTVAPNLAVYTTPPDLKAAVDQAPLTGNQFYGALAGQLGVGPTGAATYTVPIAIPPGIAGMAPNLSLVYNSQGGDGLAGQGWELSGLSMIHRCPKTRVQDGQVRPVDPADFLESTGICLDGKRLFDPENDGTYVQDINDFSEIKKSGDGFSVTTKSGETRYYGVNAKARVNAFGSPFNYVMVWALDRVVDAWGNYFQVIYNDDYGNPDFESRGLIVTEIKYTGHLPSQQPFHSITFQYFSNQDDPSVSDRKDVRHVRFGTWTLPKNKLLKSITTPLGTYKLDYIKKVDQSLIDWLMLPSQLKSIEYCAKESLQAGQPPPCLKSLDFTWRGGGFSLTAQDQTAPHFVIPKPIDRFFQGGFFQNASWRTRGTQFVDLNADGLPDFVRAADGATREAWKNTGSTFVPAPGWQLPNNLAAGDGTRAGSMLADMDGDGIVDFVVNNPGNVPEYQNGWLCEPSGPGSGLACDEHPSIAVYLNRIKAGCPGGLCWVPKVGLSTLPPGWVHAQLPTDVVTDMDGDGLADLVRIVQPKPVQNPPADGGIFGDASTGTHFDKGELLVALNRGNHWIAGTQYLFTESNPPLRGDTHGYHLEDINRDGLTDLVSNGVDPDHSFYVGLNTGASLGNVWRETSSPADPNPMAAPGTRVLGDINGDGSYDPVNFPQLAYFINPNGPDAFHVFGHASAVVGTGLGYSTAGTEGFNSALQTFGPDPQVTSFPSFFQSTPALQEYAFNMADMNGDGLADLILNHSNGGQLLVNTGATWKDVNNATTRQTAAGPDGRIPFVPSDETGFGANTITPPGSVFIDLDGDGLTDLVKAVPGPGDTALSEVYLNRFTPPVIWGFPNGLAQQTVVSYVPITTEAAHVESSKIYDDTEPVQPGTTALALPLRVVSEVATEDGRGIGTLSSTRYQYRSLRGSATGRGPQGFLKTIVTETSDVSDTSDPSGIVTGTIGTRTETTYSQAYPYTGMPLMVEKFKGATQLSKTTTDYCDQISSTTADPPCTPSHGAGSGVAYPPMTTSAIKPLQVYPLQITDVAYLPGGGDKTVTTLSTFRYDKYGNPTTVTIQTDRVDSVDGDEGYRKITHSEYGDPNDPDSDERKQGKPTWTSVLTEKIDGGVPAIPHNTAFDYAPQAGFVFNNEAKTFLVLKKSKVEPGSSPSSSSGALENMPELHTAYDYDTFGNVITTKSCASDFANCLPEGTNGNSEDPRHPPFRTTRVSYDPAFFNSPAGGLPLAANLGYSEKGRFPVRTENAAGHVEYSAYDPIKGVLLQKTGPNGIHSCYQYDEFGHQTKEIARCGSDHPLETTVTQYDNAGSDAATFRVVTKTNPPTGATTWAYSDVFGRTAKTVAYGFDGTLVEMTHVTYNKVGQVSIETKPRSLGGLNYSTIHKYDELGPERITRQELGVSGVGEIRRIFQGSTIVTEEDVTVDDGHGNIHGETRQRTETKNVLGKVSRIVDAKDNTIDYRYDADGNLTRTTDPSENLVQLTYDIRGRKVDTIDPDLGHWTYIYNGFGDLIEQRDAKPTVTSMKYDVLGRMTKKTDESGTAEWVYDEADHGKGKLAGMVNSPDTKLNGPCNVEHTTLTDGNRAGRWFKYAANGDVEEAFECADGSTFSTKFEYEPTTGRQSIVRYPEIKGSRLAVVYTYSNLGHLQFLTDEADGKLLWQATEMNAMGQVTAEKTRNGVDTYSTRNPSTGWLMGSLSTSHAENGKVIQNWEYRYDEVGNLRWRGRADAVNIDPSTEIFAYDKLDRLLSSQVIVPSQGLQGYDHTEPFVYDDLGNLTSKAGTGQGYGEGCLAGNRAAGPHAICTVAGGGPAFVYDDNGNLTSGSGRTITYNPSNKPVEILSAGTAPGTSAGKIDFAYGADGNRVVQRSETSSDISRTVYVGLGGTGKSLYERTTKGTTPANTTVEHTQFIYAGGTHSGNAFAVRVITTTDSSASAPTLKYFHYDHLGSVTAISDDVGHVVDATWGGAGGADAGVMGYDPWGARRSPEGRPANPASFNHQVGHREFTGHEAIPNVGLVNMNGRVYDPMIGRFLSPDPTVQFVGNLQSYNRYSYVLNGPLRYTDPTGYYVLGDDWDPIVTGVLGIVATVACAATGPGAAACIAAGIASTAWTATTMAAAGAGLDQIVVTMGFEFAAGMVGARLGGKEIGGQLIAGAVSGAVIGAVSTAVFGGSLGANMLSGAANGALAAAMRWAQRERVLSMAGEVRAQGSGGAGAARVEKVETLDSVLADAGVTGHGTTDADLLNANVGETQPGARMTHAQAARRYGAIAGGRWANEGRWMIRYNIPEKVVNDPSYHMINARTGELVTSFRTNRDLVPMLDNAFENLRQHGLLDQLDTWHGSFSIRENAGGTDVSFHSWGIAIDINKPGNEYGNPTPIMNPQVVRGFTGAGFTWGGAFAMPDTDGMHFSLGY
jgi:RHS repeat-associated protein